MAKLQQGDNKIRIQDVATPTEDSDAATKAYVDDNGGSNLTAGNGIDITSDVVSVTPSEILADATNPGTVPAIPADDTQILYGDGTWQDAGTSWTLTSGVTVRPYGTGTTYDNVRPSTDATIDILYNSSQNDIALSLANDAVSTAKILDNAVTADILNVSGNGTDGQVLSSDGDGSFTWVAQTGGNVTDWNNANFGNFDTDGTISWSYNSTDDPSSSGEVSVTDDGVAGHTLRFRTEDVDTINSVSVNYFQIGFGSPIAFATYAVADLTIADDFVDVSLIDGPLDGDDLLASLPADNTALTIIVSVSQFRLGIDNLTDVDTTTTAPVDNDILTWNATNSAWEPERSQVASVVGGAHIDVFSTGSVFTVNFDEIFDLWNGATDWTQINTGTPTGTNILWDTATNTLTVPSLGLDDDDNTRTVLDILLTARSGMAVHIRQENTTSDPSGFQSGFYQILDIDAKASPDEVTIKLLPDDSDIFNETAGNTYTYELSILQFVTGGTLDNLTIEGLADVTIDTLEDDQFLRYNATNSVWQNVNVTLPTELDDFADVSDTAPTDEQVLTWNATDSLWEPADAQGGGGQSDTDYNNASYGSIDEDGTITWAYSTADNPLTEGQVVIDDEGTSGYILQFRTEDIDTVNSVSVRLLQIGFGSPISFATYAVSDLTIADDFVDVSLIDGPLDGDDILATLPADATALSITVSVSQFRLPLSGVSDVSTTAPANDQVLTWNSTDSLWEPQASQAGGATTLNGLNDVNTSGVGEGFIIRYDDTNDDWRAHSIGDTNRLHGGLDIDMPTDFTIPAATGVEAIAMGYNADASGAASIAIGRDSISTHENASAFGENATTGGNNEVRLGGENAHVTIDTNLAGSETFDNQLASVKYVKDAISDSSRIVSDSIDGIYYGVREELDDPWSTYEIDPFLADAVTRQVATSVQFYDYSNENTNTFEAGVFQRVSTTVDQEGGSDLTNNTIPDFFEEETNVQTDNNIGAVGGEDSGCLGWKYVGYQDAKVWMANPVGVPIQLRWVNHDLVNASVSVPQVGIRLEWVRVKPQTIGDATVYDLSDNDFVTSLGGTTNQYYTHGTTIAAGDTQAHSLTFVLPTQTFSEATTISDDDVIAFRYVVFFHGNEFASDPAENSGLSLDIYWQALGSNNPMFGIETVDVSDQLVIESTGDLRYTDNISGNDILVVDNVDGVPVIPTASLAITGGDGITIDGDDIDVNLQTDSGLVVNSTGLALSADLADLDNVAGTTPTDGQVLTFDSTNSAWLPQDASSGTFTAGNGIAIADSTISAVAIPSVSGLVVGALGIGINTARAEGTFINSTDNTIGVSLRGDLTGNGIAIGGSGTNQGLFVDLRDTNSGLARAADGLLVDSGDGITVDSAGVSIDFADETNQPLEIATGGGLTLNIDEDGPLQKTANGLDVVLETNGGLAIGSLASGLEVLLPANSGLQKTSTGLSLNAAIGDLSDVAATVAIADQFLGWNTTNSMWEPRTVPGGGGGGVTTLAALNDVAFGTGDMAPAVGQTMLFDGANWGNGIYSLTLEEIADGPVYPDGGIPDGSIIQYSQSDGRWDLATISGNHSFTAGTGLTFNSEGTELDLTADLKDIVDVNVTTPSEGQVLTWDNAASEWIAAAIPAGGTFFDYFAPTSPTSADASSTNALAIGDGAAAGSTAAVSIGLSATADGNSSVVLGNAASANSVSTSGIAIGRNAASTAVAALAVGQNAAASSLNTVAVGLSAAASGSESVAIGDTTTASGARSVAIGNSASASQTGGIAIGDSATAPNTGAIGIGDAATNGGTNSVSIGAGARSGSSDSVTIGNSAGTAGNKAIAIGDDPSTGTNALAIAIGERAQVNAVRGIAIGSSSNSSADDADLVTANGTNSIAMGRASRASGTSTVAIGDGAQTSANNAIAIGSGAIATTADTTVLGSGNNHRLFAGTREMFPSTISENADNTISGSISSDYWTGPSFNSNSTGNEELNYIEQGDFVSGSFNFTVAGATTTNFGMGDRWVITTTSAPMLAAFGFASPDHRISLGTVSIDATTSAAGAMGQFHLLPGTTATSVQLGFRIFHVWGDVARTENISCNFSLLKR